MKMTAKDLLSLGVIDEIVPEPEGGAHEDPQKAVDMLEEALYPQFAVLIKLSGSRLKEGRYRKFREMGRP